jgi:hypothetical protein
MSRLSRAIVNKEPVSRIISLMEQYPALVSQLNETNDDYPLHQLMLILFGIRML